MINKIRYVLILGAALATLSPLARAADQAPAPAAEQPGKPRERLDEFKHLVQELALSDAQKDQIKAVLKERRTAMEALPKEDRRGPKAQEIREGSRQKIRALLTPEQQQKFDAMRPEPRGKGKKKD